MDFEPNTTIYFCHTGIDDFNKVVCSSNEEVFSTLTKQGNVVGQTRQNSFQRADGYFTIRVDSDELPYYALLRADTVIYKNEDTLSAFWLVGNILSVEWKSPNCSFVQFKIDPFMSYQHLIDWNKTNAFIEREHIKNDWSSDGGNPLFSNMGPAEDFNVQADTPVFTWTKSFTPNYVMVQSPYGDDGKASFEGETTGHLYSSLVTKMLFPNGANEYFEKIAENKDASINNIVGVYGVPSEFSRCITNGETSEEEDTIPAVNIAAQQLPQKIEYNNAKCWSSPFYTVRLMTSDGQRIDFTPQWFGNDVDEYTIKMKYSGAGKQFGGAACTFFHKNGSFNWDAWNDFTVMLTQLPSCPWTGDGFTDWASVNMKSVAANGVAAYGGFLINSLDRFARGGVGLAALSEGNAAGASYLGNAITGQLSDTLSTGATLANLSATIQQQKASGATVSGVGGFSSLFDIGANCWGFKVIYYGAQLYAMYSVDQYFDRFGYRVNKLKKLELENRPIWTFIKTAECHVASSMGVPYTMEKAINNMFNHGVTMWKRDKYIAGRQIGDFSNAKENRGIKG